MEEINEEVEPEVELVQGEKGVQEWGDAFFLFEIS
jgi:hypothetical protein